MAASHTFPIDAGDAQLTLVTASDEWVEELADRFDHCTATADVRPGWWQALVAEPGPERHQSSRMH